MAILIKDMKIPKTCIECRMVKYGTLSCACYLIDKVMEYEYANKKRHPDCPLIEVKEHTYILDTMDHIKEIAKKGLPYLVTAYEINGRNYFKVEDEDS